jgi:sporulation protein YlmC with PRC-barrel domain/CBS domain-containing protein
MLYFSELKNKKVYTEDNIYIGKLQDLVFRYTEVPRITSLVIRHAGTGDIIIPITYLQKIQKTITIEKKYETTTQKENELCIDKNILDKQIIDIEGSKVVRANDILIQEKEKGTYLIIGVDIGILGVLRWFRVAQFGQKINSLILNRNLKRSVLSWSSIQPLEMAQGKLVLNVAQSKLQNLHPEDLADYLESTNIKNVIHIINSLDREFASEVIAELNLNYQIPLLKKLPLDATAKIIELMDPDEAVDVLTEFAVRRRQVILNKLDPKARRQLEALLKFSNTSVGKYITTDFMSIPSVWSAAKVLAHLKKDSSDIPFLNYLYVVNSKNQLVGVFNLHELILQKPETPVFKFMNQNLIVVHLKTGLEIVLRKLIRYKLFALPVVDKNKNILGIVTSDDISEVFLKKI